MKVRTLNARKAFHPSYNSVTQLRPTTRPLTAKKIHLVPRPPPRPNKNELGRIETGTQDSFSIKTLEPSPVRRTLAIIPKPMNLNSEISSVKQSPPASRPVEENRGQREDKQVQEEITKEKRHISTFQNFVYKIASTEAKPGPFSSKTLMEKQKSRLLRTIVGNANGSPKHKITTDNFNQSKLALTSNVTSWKTLPGENTEEEQFAEFKRGYTHGMYKPTPLMSSEKLSRKIQEHELFVEKMKEVLNERDKELFDKFETSRTNILKHAEWFNGTEAQKNVYLMLTNIEEKWLQPYTTSHLQILTEEKRQLEEELRRKNVQRASRNIEMSCKLDTGIFEKLLEKERVQRKMTMLALDEAKKGVQSAKNRLKQVHEKQPPDNQCTVPVWIQFKEHKVVFELIKKKMRGYGRYYHAYKDTLRQLDLAAHESEAIDTAKVVQTCYRELWQIIFEFFSSKEYLASYNPVFLHTKGKKERDDLLGKIFEIREIDLEKEFYEIILHLLYKQLLQEKFENLKKLQRIVFIERKWKAFWQSRRKLVTT